MAHVLSDLQGIRDSISSKGTKRYVELKIDNPYPISGEVLRSAVKRFMERIKEEMLSSVCFVGDMDLKNAAGLIEEIRDDFSLRMEILDTTMGRLVSSLLSKDQKLSCAFRAIGGKREGGKFQEIEIVSFVIIPPKGVV
jgi:hypothetical protein